MPQLPRDPQAQLLRLLQQRHGAVQLPRPAAAGHRGAERQQVLAAVAGRAEQLQGSLPLEAVAASTCDLGLG